MSLSRPEPVFNRPRPGDARRCRWWWVACWLLWLSLAGCSSDRYLSRRDSPWNPLDNELDLLSFSGPKLTPRTSQLLRRYDVTSDQRYSPEALSRLQARIQEEPRPELLLACAELSYVGATKAAHAGRNSEAIDLYGTSVAHAYWYLFAPEFDQRRNPYDPQFRGACDLYNASLESALRQIHRRGKLLPGASYTIRTQKQEFEVQVVCRGPWHPDDFASLEFVSDFEVQGLTNRHQTFGLGVPLVVVRRQHADQHPEEKYYPPGFCFPATAFLRVLEPPNQAGHGAEERTRHCVLELHDPLHSTDLPLAGRVAPLETDITTPLAFLLDNDAFRENKTSATLGLLNPNRATANKGLFMLEPYDPRRIPVLMVHGLWSSPTTWMEMFNDLRAFPEIRQRYQFWFYLYPTGQPFWVSATQLRQDLVALRQNLDPDRRTPTFDRMVLVGHSMGGLVSRMQVIESGDRFWRLVTDKPFEELKADDETRSSLARNVFFTANPAVRRIITIGTPHQGSSFANDYTRWVSRKVIRLPAMMMQLTQRVIRENPGYFQNTDLLTITTSIDSLAPDSPVLPALAQSPRAPWVHHHNIVGVVPKSGLVGTFAGDGDGIVSLASARLEGADSEIVVPADHVTVHQHPRSILEVRRILLEHEQQFLSEVGAFPDASFADQPFGPEPALVR